MSIKRGVVTEVTSNSARPISVSSTLPIALVLVSSVVPVGVYGFDSPKQGLEYFKSLDDLKTDTGNLEKYLSLGEDMFALIVPTIVSVVEHVDDEAQMKAGFIEGINVIKRAASMPNMALSSGGAIGYKADVIAAAYDAFDMDVSNAVINVCNSIAARGFVDLNASSNGEAITRRDSFGSDRITVAKCSLEIFNTDTATTEEYDSGVILAWLRCWVDGSSSTGYAQSISNRVLTVSGVSSPSEFYAGALDETDPLTEKQIMSFIHYKGFRTWEYSTTSADPIWQDARRVRIFDLASEAVIDGIFFAVDKDLNELNAAKDSLRGFMNGLVGDDVMIGFNVELDLERTTKERITAGEFYFIVDAQEMPSPKLIHVTFNRVDQYAGVVYKMLDQ
jgi:phage tail sheath protein FI